MMLKKTVALLAFFIGMSLVAFSLIPGMEMMDLAKMLALSIGATILISLAYDRLRKVSLGDRVVVVSSSFYPAIFGRHGKVAKVSKNGNEVKVKLDDGEEVVGIVESHETLFSPPVVRAMYSERKIE
jgi:hypothetical protein